MKKDRVTVPEISFNFSGRAMDRFRILSGLRRSIRKIGRNILVYCRGGDMFW